jgi:hypothetical protein
MKKIINRLNIFLFIVLLSVTLDNTYFQCFTPSFYTFFNNFFHHILSMYLWFGSLIFGHYKLHLLFLATVLSFQYFYGWKCVITLEYNKACSFTKDEHHKDVIFFLGNLMPLNFPYYKLIVLLVLYDVYSLLINSK